LLGAPTGTLLNNQFGGYGSKVELAEQDGFYYGFTLTRATGKLYRMFFGTNVHDPVMLTNVGGLGKNSVTWRAIDIVKEGTEYIGLIIDNHGLYRVSFGNDLTSTPTVTETIFEGDPISTPIDMAVVQDGGDRYVFVSNLGNDKLVRIKFNNAFNSVTPDIEVDAITVTGSVVLSGISFIKDCETWYGFGTSVVNGRVYKIAFDSGLEDTTPTIADYSVGVAAGISVVKENSEYLVFAQSQNATPALYRMNFGSSLSGNPVAVDELKDYGIAGTGMWGFSMYKVGTEWLVMSVENAGPGIFKSTFPNNCFSSESTSTESNPVLTTENAGNFFVTLTVTDGSGNESSITNPLTVTSSTAPDINFNVQNICEGHDVNFTSGNTSGGITYDWQFGDGDNSTTASPTHQYTAGSYDVTLTVNATSSGCENFVTKPLRIYSPPVADFQVPTGLICTNNNFTFINNTTDTYGGQLVYQWSVDGQPVGNSRDLVHAFSTTGDKSVKLNTSIPGCFDEEEDVLPGILAGPEVDYVIDGQCQQTEVRFTNLSPGPVAGYEWDFGNGETSATVNGSASYDNTGSYDVSLSATGTNGCVTINTKNLVVYSKPVVSFSLDLPPFSCAGTPSQFHDVTPPPFDSNITQWNWTFGDNGTGTGKDPVHTYAAAGTFNVQLSVTTDKGCISSEDHEVAISPSPVAAFTLDPTCLNKATHFTSTSTGSIKSYQWKIANQVYVVENPTHVFAATGNSSAQLTVTGNNDCVSTVTKPFVVPVVPVLDFQVANRCSRHLATFTDLTPSPTDPIALQTWTFESSATRDGKVVDYGFVNAGTYPVKLDIVNQSGCVYSLTRQVTINPTPVAAFTMSDDTGPPPLHVSFTNTSTGAASYQWNFHDGSAIRTEPSQERTYNELGNYSVSLTATSVPGCNSTHTRIVSVIIPVNELSLEEFSVVQSGSAYRGYVRVHNSGNYRITGFSVTYDVGGGILVKENIVTSLTPGQSSTMLLSNEFANPGANGYICAELQADNNLVDNKQCAAFTGSVVLTPYPNPTDVYLNVETVQPEAGTVRVLLYNSSGGNAYDKTFDVGAGLSRLSLDVQNLSPGVYVVVITAGRTIESRKILIHR
jgi:PKD repeat protein